MESFSQYSLWAGLNWVREPPFYKPYCDTGLSALWFCLIHSFSSLSYDICIIYYVPSYDRSKASSKASSPLSAI